MKPESRSNIYAIFGFGSLSAAAYAFRKTFEYLGLTGGTVGTLAFGLAGVILMIVAVAHFYMASAYRFGQLEAVTGNFQSATLEAKSGVIAKAIEIRFVRKPDADDLSTTPESRYVFFIGGWRPWVCLESGFLKPGDPASSV